VTAVLTPIGRTGIGQPRTYRLDRDAKRQAAYRRLALAILSLDVPTLTSRLRSARRATRQMRHRAVSALTTAA
jgi:hypothetical protein